jgi:glycerol-3-phosphate acyltransferase PlsY
LTVICVFLSYLIGAIPFGYLFFRLSDKKDVRTFGSRSTGATNILRLKGWAFALPVMVFDISKGLLPPLLALKIFGDSRLALFCAFAAVVGHCFPVFIGFRGGKGVATTVGAYAVLGLKPLLLSLIVFVLVIAVTRYVSLGSLLAALSFPLFVLLLGEPTKLALLGLAAGFVIVFRHRENIRRLFAGTERKFGEKVSV